MNLLCLVTVIRVQTSTILTCPCSGIGQKGRSIEDLIIISDSTHVL